MLITLLMLFVVSVSAQQGINYKAIIKDASGNVVANQNIEIQFSILQGAAQTMVYQEANNPDTDASGLILLNIGEGNVISGDFTSIDWGSDTHFLKTEIDLTGGTNFTDLGTTEFKAVPYALNVTGLEKITENSNTGWRLKGQDPANYGDIGADAIDLSYSSSSSTTRGATGNESTAMGSNTIASGYFSTAMGYLTTASGSSSTAMGNGTTASGYSSTAMGLISTASGYSSTAMGINTSASENYSTAMGSQTTASGNTSTAMGSNTIASGNFSTAMGLVTTAPSYAETVIGANNTDYTPNSTSFWNIADRLLVVGNGSNSSNKSNALTILKNGTITAPSFEIAQITDDKALITKEYADVNLISSGLEKITEGSNTGWRLKGQDPANYGDIGSDAVDLSYSSTGSVTTGATGLASTAMGVQTTASGYASTAMGLQTTASESNSTAMGSGSIASGDTSVAMGNYTTASGRTSTAMGSNTTASGTISTAMGHTTTASGYSSTTMGYATTASGNYSTAMGYVTTAPSFVETTIGINNTIYTPNSTGGWDGADRLFVVGNGVNVSNRSNALTILKNGTITAPSFEIAQITDDKALITKEYLETNFTNDNLGNHTATTDLNMATNNITGVNYVSTRATSDYDKLRVWNTGNFAIGLHNDMTYGFLNDYAMTFTMSTETDRGWLWRDTADAQNDGAMSLTTDGRMTLKSDLVVNGNASKPGGGSWAATSDKRLKQNINPYNDGLETLLKIKPVKYQYNQLSGYNTNPEHIGVIAQDLQKVAPYMVSSVKRDNGEFLAVDNSAMTYMLINAVKEQQQEINQLKKELEDIKQLLKK